MRVLDDRSRVFREATRGLRVDGWRFSRVAASLLPRLELDVERIDQLDTDLWQVEVAIENVGAVATLPGRLASRGGAVQLAVEGAVPVALASATPRSTPGATSGATGSPFRLMAETPSRPALGTLGAGETARVRLWLRAREGARCRLSTYSVRGGEAEVELLLR